MAAAALKVLSQKTFRVLFETGKHTALNKQKNRVA